MKNLFVANSPGKGRGVFADANFKNGYTIEIAPYICIKEKDWKAIESTDIDRYWYEIDSGEAGVGCGYTSLYNHSNDPNAEFSFDKDAKLIIITAIKDIYTDEEIYINYGYEP